MIVKYFGDEGEDGADVDDALAPQLDQSGAFAFGGNNTQQGKFTF